MNGKLKTDRAALARLANALVEDILSASDEDILAEFQNTDGDPEHHAAGMRARFEKTLIVANKNRLAAAKAGAAASRRSAGRPVSAIDMASARSRLRAALNSPGLAKQLTLAARKESEMSDSDIVSMLHDLRELGILPPQDEGEENA